MRSQASYRAWADDVSRGIRSRRDRAPRIEDASRASSPNAAQRASFAVIVEVFSYANLAAIRDAHALSRARVCSRRSMSGDPSRDPSDDVPDARDGLTRKQRIVLRVLADAQAERGERNVPL